MSTKPASKADQAGGGSLGESQAREYGGSNDIRPVPDPTALTTQQLVREVGLLRDMFDTRFEEMDKRDKLSNEIISTRIAGMDKAIDLVQTGSNRLLAHIDEKIAALKEIHDEKFGSIQTQFKERDVRTEQSSKDSKVAVDAALQAAKEAVGEQNKSSALAISKSETSTVKQIDQLGALIQSVNKAVDDKFNDIKDRLTRIEGKEEGSHAQVVTQQSSNTLIITAIAAGFGVLFGIAGIVIALVVKH